jgi:predicted nucleotide-binding protein
MNQRSTESAVQTVLKKIAVCTRTADNDFSQTEAVLEKIERYVEFARFLMEMAPPKKSKGKKKGAKKKKADEISPILPVVPKA